MQIDAKDERRKSIIQQHFVAERKKKDFAALIGEEKLKPEETGRFLDNAFRDGALKTTGTDIDRILQPSRVFPAAGVRRKNRG